MTVQKESYGRRVNALVQYADEGRVGLRKARMSCRKAILIRDVQMGYKPLSTERPNRKVGGERAEVKHLSKRRKRNQPSVRKRSILSIEWRFRK